MHSPSVLISYSFENFEDALSKGRGTLQLRMAGARLKASRRNRFLLEKNRKRIFYLSFYWGQVPLPRKNFSVPTNTG